MFSPGSGRFVCGMETFDGPIGALVRHVEMLGVSTAGRRAVRGWLTAEPDLAGLVAGAGAVPAGFVSAGAVAAAGRLVCPADQEAIVRCLCRLGPGDELACLTAVSALAGRLASVLAGWSRRGAQAWELDGLACDLVSACWSATAGVAASVASGGSMPASVVWSVLDAAVEEVRVPRRRELRRRAASVPADVAGRCHASLGGRSGEDLLAGLVLDVARSGRLNRRGVTALFLTRAAGWDVAEAAGLLGCSPGVLRALRSRTARLLAAGV